MTKAQRAISQGAPVDAPLDRLDETIERAKKLVLSQQSQEGYWWYTLEANETIGSGVIQIMHFLGQIDEVTQDGLLRHILSQQRADGSWAIFHGGPGCLSTTVECYFALRLAGYSVDDEMLTKARAFILANGGLSMIRVFSRIHLALFGLVPWSACPAMPAWLILMPSWSGASIYEFSSWARASIVPLLMVLNKKPVRKIDFNLGELSDKVLSEKDWRLRDEAILSWRRLFIIGDHILKVLDKLPWHPGKKTALRTCEQWTRTHLEKTEDIYPALAYGILGLSAMGYPFSDASIQKAWKALHKFQQVYSDTLPSNCDDIARIHPVHQTRLHKTDAPSNRATEQPKTHQQCCISPLWDTPWAVCALLDSDSSTSDPALQKAARYLLSKQITRTRGDWAIKNKNVIPGGWAFEFENDYFPDIDDTIQILEVLERLDLAPQESHQAKNRAYNWLLSMRSKNGGWAAFDRDNTSEWVNKIPFSDHGACLDPPTADISGRMLKLLIRREKKADAYAIKQVIEFIESKQEAWGPWWGRWGVNYLYGTWCVLEGLAEAAYTPRQPSVARALRWLETVQCDDGGWGESCESYQRKAYVTLGRGVPSQTAWALMALMPFRNEDNPCVAKGIQFLIDRQRPDGTWDEPEHTGTGFPGHFYLRYHGYRHYFPLMALGRYRRLKACQKK